MIDTCIHGLSGRSLRAKSSGELSWKVNVAIRKLNKIVELFFLLLSAGLRASIVVRPAPQAAPPHCGAQSAVCCTPCRPAVCSTFDASTWRQNSANSHGLSMLRWTTCSTICFDFVILSPPLVPGHAKAHCCDCRSQTLSGRERFTQRHWVTLLDARSRFWGSKLLEIRLGSFSKARSYPVMCLLGATHALVNSPSLVCSLSS